MNYARIGVLGDTHGQLPSCLDSVAGFSRQGVSHVLQLGDFGFWGNKQGQSALTRLNEALDEAGQVWYITEGNHEDYDYFNSVERDDDGWRRLRSNILLAYRGQRWNWGGISFLSLGGAPSVDRQWRLEKMRDYARWASKTGYRDYKNWWHEEAITDENVQAVVAGGTADIMVTHDSPLGNPVVEQRIRPNPLGFPEVDLQYAYQGRQRMLTAFMAVQPKVFLHGHYHFYVNNTWHVPTAPMTRDIKFTSQMVCLGCNGQKHNKAILDLNDLSVTSTDDPRRVL